MTMTKQTEVLIISFIVICIFMILFEIFHAFKMKQRDKKIKELSSQKNTVANLLASPGKLKNETNLLAFEICFDKEKEEDPVLYREHFPLAEKVFAKLIGKEKPQDNIVKSYIVYLCTKYKFFYLSNDENIKKELIYMAGDKNVYVRENALKCIYNLGEKELVLQAFRTLQSRNIHHNRKLLHDDLLEFAGNKEELADLLNSEFDNFDLEMQITLFTYFRYQTGKYCEFALNILGDKTKNKELRIQALRYLQKYPYEKALPKIIEIISENEEIWEYRAIAASCLGSYKDSASIRALKQMVTDPVWHVRKNAAESLIKLDVTKKDINEILQGEDKFAKEQLQYKIDVEALKKEAISK